MLETLLYVDLALFNERECENGCQNVLDFISLLLKLQNECQNELCDF